MSTHFAKPENALRKAADFVRVNKPASALRTLSNILASKRFRAWSPTHEKILFLYLELSVELRRSAKDGLIQYRSIAQSANSASLEKVMRYYRQLAVERTDKAEQEAVKAGVADSELHSRAADADEDDEAGDGAAMLMLAQQFGDGAKDRHDRQILLPWVRYQWDAYRTIIDVCRNNVKLEKLYHEMARAAFDYCVHFQQKAQFKKLAELMRSHLYFANKYVGQANSLDLSDPDTQALYLETRFLALQAASKLELWQEAYRVIEDIHEAMKSAHQEPNAALMKTYFEKLAEIFWASHNFLFHAYSLDKFFTLSFGANVVDESATATEKEPRQRLANTLVLASLIVSGSLNEDEILIARHEGAARLAQLLGFKRETPSRGKLMSLIASQGVLTEASDTVVAIFDLLENKVSPLTLAQQLAPLFEEVKRDTALVKYVEQLQRLTVLRVLQQLSSFYSSIRISAFLKLIPNVQSPGDDPLKSLVPFERLILNAIQSEHVALRIDHVNKLLVFPADDLESIKMRDQLVTLARSLSQLANEIEPIDARKKTQERQHVFSLIARGVSVEHSGVYARQQEIEKRKQEQERLLVEREKRESEQKAHDAKVRKAEEQRRLEEESRKREQERLKKEAEEKDLRAKQQLANEITKKVESKVSKGLATKAARKMKELTADLEKIDKAALLAAQEAVMEQERKEIERRRRETVRRIDYFTRACRVEERETLLATAEKKREADRSQLEADFARYVDEHRKAHEKALGERQRLAKMAKEQNDFFNQLQQRRTEQWKVERAKQMDRFKIRQREHEKELRRKREEEEARERERKRFEDQEAERLAREAEKQEIKRRAEEERARAQALTEERLRKEEERDRREREERESRYAAPGRSRTDDFGPRRTDDFGSRREERAPERAGWGVRVPAVAAARGDERDIRRRDEPLEEKTAPGSSWRDARKAQQDRLAELGEPERGDERTSRYEPRASRVEEEKAWRTQQSAEAAAPEAEEVRSAEQPHSDTRDETSAAPLSRTAGRYQPPSVRRGDGGAPSAGDRPPMDREREGGAPRFGRDPMRDRDSRDERGPPRRGGFDEPRGGLRPDDEPRGGPRRDQLRDDEPRGGPRRDRPRDDRPRDDNNSRWRRE